MKKTLKAFFITLVIHLIGFSFAPQFVGISVLTFPILCFLIAVNSEVPQGAYESITSPNKGSKS
jgi:hypothetical protein